MTEVLGYFHLSNAHPDSENREVYDKVHLEHSTFGRDILHCKESSNFHPWSVIERAKVETGDFDIYLLYACGPNFMLSGAQIRVEVAQYLETERRQDVEQRF